MKQRQIKNIEWVIWNIKICVLKENQIDLSSKFGSCWKFMQEQLHNYMVQVKKRHLLFYFGLTLHLHFFWQFGLWYSYHIYEKDMLPCLVTDLMATSIWNVKITMWEWINSLPNHFIQVLQLPMTLIDGYGSEKSHSKHLPPLTWMTCMRMVLWPDELDW